MDDTPVFTLHTDPDNRERTWVTVDKWTPTLPLAPELLGTESHGASIRVVGTVRFVVENGSAEYRIVGWDQAARVLRLALIESHGPT